MVVGDDNNARSEEAFYPSSNRFILMLAMMRELMVLGDGSRSLPGVPPQFRNSPSSSFLLILQAREGGNLRHYLLHSMLVDEHGNQMVAARLCRSRLNNLRRLGDIPAFLQLEKGPAEMRVQGLPIWRC